MVIIDLLIAIEQQSVTDLRCTCGVEATVHTLLYRYRYYHLGV